MARLQSVIGVCPTCAAEAAWQLVTDWPAHSRWIPLTTVTIDADSPAPSPGSAAGSPAVPGSARSASTIR